MDSQNKHEDINWNKCVLCQKDDSNTEFQNTSQLVKLNGTKNCKLEFNTELNRKKSATKKRKHSTETKGEAGDCKRAKR